MQESVLIENREKVKILGATKVVLSTQNQGVVETKDSLIVISGSELEVKKLDLENGEVSFYGKINGIKFSNGQGAKVPLLKRIFK